MRTLYLDCGMGAAGDMLAAALLELIPDPAEVLAQLNQMGLPGVTFSLEQREKCGIQGHKLVVKVHGEEEGKPAPSPRLFMPGQSVTIRAQVHDHPHPHDHEGHHHRDNDHGHAHAHDHGHDHDHSHASMDHIGQVVAHLTLPQTVKDHVMAVYQLIAAAESQVHGVPVTQIHFHEVGEMDAIADIAAVSLLMHLLQPDRVVASPIHVGSGTVRCAHGVLPVPAPATALILRGMPIYSGDIRGELCTPTGAALLKHFVHDFGSMPVMAVEQVGYGMGTKDFPAANCVRAMLGTAEVRNTPENQVLTLSCNLDDMTGEDISFAADELMKAGALDVWMQPIQMKKGRPGILISVLCALEKEETMVSLLFRHTTTLGIRVQTARRHVLDRKLAQVDTPLGSLRRKTAWRDGGADEKWEFEDIASLARQKGLSMRQVRKILEQVE